MNAGSRRFLVTGGRRVYEKSFVLGSPGLGGIKSACWVYRTLRHPAAARGFHGGFGARADTELSVNVADVTANG